MKPGRTIPPAAAPLSFRDLLRGLSGFFRGGYSEALAGELKTYFGSESVFLASSGKAALFLILKGLSAISARKKVVIPAYTCYSVPSAIVRAGLEITLCDVDPDTLDFEFDELATIVDEGTLCVVPTHLFGIPADVEQVQAICRGKGAYVVEDAAQALGVSSGERKLGTLGDVGFFSLGRGKNISCGSGGVVLTSSAEIAESMRNFHGGLEEEPATACARDLAEALFMKLFLNPSLYWFPAGLPFLGIGETKFLPDFPMHRFSESKAAMLGSWRERLEDFNRCRSSSGREYIEALGLPRKKKIYSRDLPYLRFPCYANDADGKRRACGGCSVLGASPMYPAPVHRIEEIRNRFSGTEYPGADRIAETLLTLPTHVYVTADDRERLCEKVKGVIGEGGSRGVPHDG